MLEKLIFWFQRLLELKLYKKVVYYVFPQFLAALKIISHHSCSFFIANIRLEFS